MSNIISIDPVYIRFRKMWQEDRWKFSGTMVNLTIKMSKEGLNEQEQHIHDTLNRIVEENNGNWLEPEVPRKSRKRG